MNLEEFVQNVLVDLDKAITAARKTTSREISFTSTQSSRTVEFDIAVAVEESAEKSGKAGVRVLQFVEGGGQISKTNKNSTVSRIKFGVHVDTFTKDENQQFQSVDL